MFEKIEDLLVKLTHSKQGYKLLTRLNNIFVLDAKYRRRWRSVLLKEYYSNKIKYIIHEKYKDYYVFFSRNGVGDVFFAASLMHEFKKRNPGKIVYLTEKKSIAKFLKTFKAIDKVIYDKDFEKLQGMEIVQRRIKKEQLNFLYFPYRGNKPNYTFCDSYANLLNVPLDVERELPQISEEHIEIANKEFEKLKIKSEKTIILIPENVMWDYKVLKPKFWKKLADQLIKKGYDVVFNSKNKQYKNYKNTFININAFIYFSSKVKHIVSFRSGINDLLAGMGIENQTTIYPYNMDVIWANKFIFDELLNKYHVKLHEYELDNLMQIYSLTSIFKKEFNEIIFDGNEDHLLTSLLKHID